MSRFFNLVRDRKGAAVIELALAAPVLAIMVVGISDISVAYGKKLQLEQAAQRAIEKVAQTTGEKTPEDTIKEEAMCQYNGTDDAGECLPAPITADSVVVTYGLTCDAVAKTYSEDCTGTEVEVRYISATVSDTYTPMFNTHFGTNADGTYHLSGTAGVRVQ